MSSILHRVGTRKSRKLILALLVVAAWAYRTVPTLLEDRADVDRSSSSSSVGSSGAVEEAFRAQRSDQWLETSGTVERILADDRHGSQHQRFLLRVTPEITVLVAHNIDLAERVPIATGDRLELRGEYEWNDKGGVIHWTHHDPKGRKQGGWIRAGGKTYL